MVKVLENAAKHKHASSYNNIGRAYHVGRGVGVNMTEAMKWYEKAMDYFECPAIFNLAWCYKEGHGEIYTP